MKPRKKLFIVIAAAVIVALSAAILWAASRRGGGTAVQAPSPSPTPLPAAQEPTPTAEADPVAAYMNGSPVSISELSTYIALSVDNLLSELNMDSVDWDSSEEDTAVSDYVKKDALEILRLYTALESKAAELGITLTSDERESVASWHDDAVKTLGGETAYEEYLTKNHMSENTYLRIYTANLLYNHIYDYYYGQKGQDLPSQEEADAWADENGIFHISRIFLSTEGADSAQKILLMQQALKISRQLAEGADYYRLAGQNDSYGSEYLEASRLPPQYVDALRALSTGDISGVLEADDGYSIIKREPVDVKYLIDHYPEFVADRFNELISQWVSRVELSTTEAYDSFNAASVFEN